MNTVTLDSNNNNEQSQRTMVDSQKRSPTIIGANSIYNNSNINNNTNNNC